MPTSYAQLGHKKDGYRYSSLPMPAQNRMSNQVALGNPVSMDIAGKLCQTRLFYSFSTFKDSVALDVIGFFH